MISCRGFNEALNGFTDEGWSMMGNDSKDIFFMLQVDGDYAHLKGQL